MTNSIGVLGAKRDPKYITEPVDRVRYSDYITLANGQNLIVEEPPRWENRKLFCFFRRMVAGWSSEFNFGLITHSQALANKFVGAAAQLLREMGFEFEYERANEFKLKGSLGIDPSFWGSGIGAGSTKKGANRLIISDCLRSGTDAMSQKIRESIITDVISTAMNRLGPCTCGRRQSPSPVL